MIKLALSLFPKIIPLEEWTTDGLRGKSSHPQYLANKLVKRLWYGWAGINIAHRPGKDPLWASHLFSSLSPLSPISYSKAHPLFII